MACQPYPAPAWLPGGHAQTLWPLLIKGPLPRYRRERWDTPDADFIDLDWIDGKPDAPCIVLFHGPEGSSRSHYARHFLRTLIPAAVAKDQRFPGRMDIQRARAARTLRDFDDAVTAPLHGFAGANDYYTRSSAKPLLHAIRTPTLLLHAANDPFLPATALPHHDLLPATVTLETSSCGGHAGFVHGAFPGRIDWLPQRLLAHFSGHLPASAGMR